MKMRFPELVTIYKLDEWYREIVFIKAGTYTIDGMPLAVIGRRVDALNLTDGRFQDGRMG